MTRGFWRIAAKVFDHARDMVEGVERVAKVSHGFERIGTGGCGG